MLASYFAMLVLVASTVAPAFSSPVVYVFPPSLAIPTDFDLLITFAAPPVCTPPLTNIVLYGHDVIVIDLSISSNREIAGMIRDEHPNSGFDRRIQNGDILADRSTDSEDSKPPPSPLIGRRNEQTRNDDILGRTEDIGVPDGHQKLTLPTIPSVKRD